MKKILRPCYRTVLRCMGATPMLRVMAEIRRRKYDLKKMKCLEVFGGTGDIHLLDYAKLAGSLEVWEIDPVTAGKLQKNIPKCNVRVVDSYQEVNLSNGKFDLIIIDNPMSVYGKWCEHFGLFPAVFNRAADIAVMIIAVTPNANKRWRAEYPYLFNAEQNEWRQKFYRTENPEDVSFETMVKIYGEHARSKSFAIDWWFTQKRTHMHYLVLGIHKS